MRIGQFGFGRPKGTAANLTRPETAAAETHVRDNSPNSPRAQARAGRAWTGFLLLGTALSAAYFLLPSTEQQDYAYQVPEMLTVVAILIAIRLHRPSDARPWLFLAAGIALIAAGDWTWVILDKVYGIEPFPSLADVFYLGGMGFIGMAFLRLLRGRVPGGDRAGLLDALIVSVGVGLISWVFLMAPIVADSSQPLGEIGVALAYPMVDIVLLGVLVRLLLAPGSKVPALRLLIGALLAYLVADFPYAVLVLGDGYTTGYPVDAGWLMGAVLFGAAALHPSMRTIAEPAEPSDVRLSRWRLALLAGASLMAPAVLLTQWLAGTHVEVPVIAAGCVILFLLVITRLSGVVTDLRGTLDQRRALESELERRALHDPLTGLANRTLFNDRLEHALLRRGSRVSVLFLDLDDFKTVNDAFGHAAGDELLRIVATEIRSSVRPEDTVARLGGDEFAVLLGNDASAYEASLAAGRLLDAVQAPALIAGERHTIGVSIGISQGKFGAATAEALMRDADIAMYVAKGQGKGRFVVFEASAHEAVVRGLELRTDLEGAVRDHQFELQYQPIINLEEGDVAGVEALVRWRHPRRGLLSPAEFVPMAEATGAIAPLGRWILGEAIRQGAAWRADGPTAGDRFVSVNLATAQLADPRLVDTIAQLLQVHGLPASCLVLEVTESARLDESSAEAALLALHEIGVRLAIDDFGTGYAALSHLSHVPFDLVKIDRSFVGALGTNARAEHLITGIYDLARRLDARVVAEGIDDPRQVVLLRRIGLTMGQGFYFAGPMPPAELEALLAGAKPRASRRPRAAHASGAARAVSPRP